MDLLPIVYYRVVVLLHFYMLSRLSIVSDIPVIILDLFGQLVTFFLMVFG